MAYDLAISLVVHNGRPHVEKCLESIFCNTGSLRIQVIIIDNASEDGFGPWVRQRYPAVVYVRNAQNVYFTRGQNRALSYANAPYVLVLNPDITVHGNAIEQMLDYMRKHSDIGVLCAKLLNPDGTFQDPRGRDHHFVWAFWQISLLSSFWKPSWVLRRRMYDGQPKGPQDVDAVTGACMLMPRQAINQVGLFDEGFWMYSEENDLCLRMRQAGWRVVYYPDATMTHIWQASTRLKNPIQMKRIEWNSLLYYFRKHRSLWSYGALLVLSLITFPILAVRLWIRMREAHSPT